MSDSGSVGLLSLGEICFAPGAVLWDLDANGRG